MNDELITWTRNNNEESGWSVWAKPKEFAPKAPEDDKVYGQQNGHWVEIEIGGIRH